MLSALAALCLSACNNDDEVSVNDGAVRFTASIGKEAVATPQSRAAGTSWHAGDEIGIFMVNHSTNDIASAATNRQFTTKGDGRFTPTVGNEIYYPMDNSAVDFIAYYPYEAGAKLSTDLAVNIPTVQDAAAQADADLMWAKADNNGPGYTKDEEAATPVALTFGHCLAKLTMNCTVDPSVGDASLLANATVTIRGMYTVSAFDLTTGTLTGIPATPADITARRLATATAGSEGTFDAIILPATYSGTALKVDFNLPGETFTWDVKAITFKPGHEYIYQVIITRTGVTATGTIAPWTPVVKDDPVYAE